MFYLMLLLALIYGILKSYKILYCLITFLFCFINCLINANIYKCVYYTYSVIKQWTLYLILLGSHIKLGDRQIQRDIMKFPGPLENQRLSFLLERAISREAQMWKVNVPKMSTNQVISLKTSVLLEMYYWHNALS